MQMCTSIRQVKSVELWYCEVECRQNGDDNIYETIIYTDNISDYAVLFSIICLSTYSNKIEMAIHISNGQH